MKRRKLLTPEPEIEPRACEVPGCSAEGIYRAPYSRAQLQESRWFCLDHAREYNAAWDFFAGMSQTEIERYLRDDLTGHRPTWPFGLGPLSVEAMRSILDGKLRDSLGLFGTAADARHKAPSPVPPEKRQALAKLDLRPGSTVKEIKARYKELVKRYHPDLNGGDRSGEEKLRVVNEAYRVLVRRAS